MSIASLHRMFLSETEGWSELVRVHPSPRGLMRAYVAPMSLIPLIMYGYAGLVAPGAVFPAVVPAFSGVEMLLVGGLFFATELAMVWLMASYIQQSCEEAGFGTSFEGAFTLAAVAPTPLWLSSLALFIPSSAFNVAVVLLAWFGSAALIRHGVRPLLEIGESIAARRMANTITFAGVMAWVALMVLLALLVSFVVGWR